MAGLLSYMAAGAAAGAGTAMADEGKMLREQRLRELDQQFRAGEAEKDRGFRRELQDDEQGFRSGESAKDRQSRIDLQAGDQTFRQGESEKDRQARMDLQESEQGFRSGESAADREFRKGESDKERTARQGLLSNSERFTDANGKEWVRGADGVAKPLKDESGAQISGEDKLGTKRRSEARAYADSIIGKGDSMADPAARQKSWDKAYSDYMANPERDPSRGATAPAAEAQLAPASPKDRKTGVVYRNPNGVKAEWTGSGWKPVN